MSGTTRRNVLTGGAALAAAGLVTGTAFAANSSGIERAWARAEALKGQIAALRAPFAVTGANDLVRQRHDALLEILRARPASTRDIAIMEQAAADAGVRHRLAGWANIQVGQAKSAVRNAAFA